MPKFNLDMSLLQVMRLQRRVIATVPKIHFQSVFSIPLYAYSKGGRLVRFFYDITVVRCRIRRVCSKLKKRCLDEMPGNFIVPLSSKKFNRIVAQQEIWPINFGIF